MQNKFQSETINPASPNLESRRQFFRSLGEKILIYGLGHRLVEAQEINNTDSWAIGLDKIRQSALTQDYEIAAQFVSKNERPGRWVESVKGETGHVTFNARESMRKAIKEGNTKVLTIHTHTLKSAVRSRKQRAQFENFSTPPSFLGLYATGDLGYAFDLENDYGFEIDIENGVVDPAGLWIFKVDKENDFYKKYTTAKNKLFDVALKIKGNNKVSGKFSEYLRKFSDLSASIYLILEKYSSDLSPEELEFCKNGFKPYSELFEVEYKEAVENLVKVELSYGQGQQDLPELIKLHKAVGINLQFFNHQQAKAYNK